MSILKKLFKKRKQECSLETRLTEPVTQVPIVDVKPKFKLYEVYEGKIGECMKQLEADGLQIATFAQLVDLFYAEELEPTRDNKLNNLITATYQTVLRDGTVVIQDRPTLDQSGLPPTNHSELINKLELGDDSVRIVQQTYTKEFKDGEQLENYPIGERESMFYFRSIAKHPFVIALVGEEGAEKLKEIGRNYSSTPVVDVRTCARKREAIFHNITLKMGYEGYYPSSWLEVGPRYLKTDVQMVLGVPVENKG